MITRIECIDLRLSNRSFEVFSKPVTWKKALKTCRSQGGKLWEIKTKSDHIFSSAILDYSNISTIWLGANVKKGLFWNGEHSFFKSDYSNWESPKERKTGFCVASDKEDSYTWLMEDCTLSYPFLCQHIADDNVNISGELSYDRNKICN